MDSKKSLGHFPFGPGSQGDSDYSFIPDLNQSEDVDVDSVEVDETDFFQSRPVESRKPEPTADPKPDDLQFIQIGSVKVKKTRETESFREQEERSSQESSESFIVEREIIKSSSDSSDSAPKASSGSSKKKIVSYYLNEDLIDRLKAYADSVKESYSAVAAASFEEYLKKKEQ